MQHIIEPIAFIHTPFTQKFGIPRQSLALSKAKGSIVFSDKVDVQQACMGLSSFTHLWLLFIFHENINSANKAMIRPPRLGGNEKIGVFASRSSFRPNNIGLSLVKNDGLIDKHLHVSGVDLLDNTPIIDIKPYLPYADILPNANASYAQHAPEKKLEVVYTKDAELNLGLYASQHQDLPSLIENVLQYDPRPAYKQNKADPKEYKFTLYALQITWRVIQNQALVLRISE